MNIDQIPITIFGLTLEQILLLKRFYEEETGYDATEIR